jgi:thiamine kinase-like enzyme
MSALEDAVERVWPGRDTRVEVLGGGITNHNLKVEVDDERYVLRVAGKDTGLLGIDRGVELAATQAAAAAGIGPQVVAFVEPEGWLVTRFVEGASPLMTRMREPEMLARVASALRAFHAGPPIPGTFDSFRVVEAYRATALERGGHVPSEFEWAHEIARRIEGKRAADAPVPCHNDLLNANFLDDGGRLCIVDWEYAGMGDRFFDLANFSINHELDDAASAALLDAYFGEARDADVESLALMRFMSDFREAMWGVVQNAVSELDFDFVAYATEHFERLRRTAEAPAFRTALSTPELRRGTIRRPSSRNTRGG